MDIKFKFSNQYEQVIAQGKPVSFERGTKAVASIEKLWRENRTMVIQAFKFVTGLDFRNGVDCYVNSRASFSDPLSLKISAPLTMLDNLIHELVHVILTQNTDIIGGRIKLFHEEYKDENFVTRIHILVHAIHLLIAEKIFPSRIGQMRSYSKSPDYVKSWEIMDSVGAAEIVKTVFH